MYVELVLTCWVCRCVGWYSVVGMTLAPLSQCRAFEPSCKTQNKCQLWKFSVWLSREKSGK